MSEKSRLETHRNFAIARGEGGGALIQPDLEGIWRYVFENGELDTGSQVDMRNPVIKLEADPMMITEESVGDLGMTALHSTAIIK